jgi:hypothetical protein
MKRNLLLICVAFFAGISGLGTTAAYSYNNYNTSYYNNNYSSQYHSSSNCSSYDAHFVCWIDGDKTKTFTNTCYLNRDSRYSYAYSDRCSSSQTRDYKYDRDYYTIIIPMVQTITEPIITQIHIVLILIIMVITTTIIIKTIHQVMTI